MIMLRINVVRSKRSFVRLKFVDERACECEKMTHNNKKSKSACARIQLHEVAT